MPNNKGTARHTVLITGGSGGIGLELAKVFARHGHDLVLVARNRDTLEAAAGVIEGKFAITAHVYASDLTRPESPDEIFDFLHNEQIPIEILVNNAGFGLGGEFADTDVERELDMIQVNITALTHLTKLFLPPMIKRRSGKILNVASTAAFQAGPLMAVYYATKAYVVSFSEAIAEENKPFGINVMALCPGPTKTNFFEASNIRNPVQLKGQQSVEEVVETALNALDKGKSKVVSGWINYLGSVLGSIAPNALTTRVIAKTLRPKYQGKD